MAGPVVYLVGKFPQASQTFIARELREMFRREPGLRVFARRRLGPGALEEADRAWYPRVERVPRALAFGTIAANLRHLRAGGRWRRAFAAVVGLPHRRPIHRLRAIGLVWLAAGLARRIARTGGARHIHAHFALAQTELALALGIFLDLPFSFTAHAYDIYAEASALAEKIRRARFAVTCTGANAAHLRGLVPELPAGRVQLVRHGVEPLAARRAAAVPPLLLSAGRLVAKKGFEDLIAALGLLRDRGHAARLRIVGDGPLLGALRERVGALGLEDRVELPGWRPYPVLAGMMPEASVFALASRVTPTGDRDGIPNVLIEAMSAELPVVSTAVSGIPELVTDGATGLLAPPGDPPALAAAIERLLRDAGLARRLAAAGRERALREYDLARNVARLHALFGAGGEG